MLSDPTKLTICNISVSQYCTTYKDKEVSLHRTRDTVH